MERFEPDEESRGDDTVADAVVDAVVDTMVDQTALVDAAVTISAGPPTVLARRYEVLGLLGQGGMGTVYRAHDRELGEIVALKVLRRELARDPGALERFRAEVRLARRVTHRNVARTYDIGDEGDDRFLTMELVVGRSLASLLEARGGALPLALAIPIAMDVSAGLAASHEAGVVHGDLKPENIICTPGGRAVITDFGIARALVPTADGAPSGVVMGTPAYMAPEQVEGLPFDERADIYALGCMLYRVLTGEPPWPGSNFIVVATARLLHAPPDARSIAPGLPARVAETISRCMARRPEDRFASAIDVADELTRASAAASSGRRLPSSSVSSEGGGDVDAPAAELTGAFAPGAASSSTVVLLTARNDGAEDDDYLACGIAERIVTILPRIRIRLRLLGRRQALAEQPGRDLRDVGRAFGAAVVVEAVLTRGEQGPSIHLRAVTVTDGLELWQGRIADSPPSVEALAVACASRIASALDIGMPRLRPSLDAEAFDLYMRGRFLLGQSFGRVRQAAALLRAAHERAPADARIAGSYALALARQHSMDGGPPELTETVAALARSVIAGPEQVAEAHVALAVYHLDQAEHRSAAVELKKALALDATNGDALEGTGKLLLDAGRPGRAIEDLLRARAAAPAMEVVTAALARAHALLGEWTTAHAVLASSEASSAVVHWFILARLHLWRSDAAAAGALLDRLGTHRVPSKARARLQTILSAAKDGAAQEHAVDQLLSERSITPRLAAFDTQLAIEVLTATGAADRARLLLADLEDYQFLDLSWIDGCPLLAPLRESSELVALRRATGARASRVLAVLESRDLRALDRREPTSP